MLKFDPDRVHLRDRGHLGCGSHQIADLRVGIARRCRQSGNRPSSRRGSAWRYPGPPWRLPPVPCGQLVARGRCRAASEEWRFAPPAECRVQRCLIGFGQLRLATPTSACGVFERGLILPRVEFEQQLALLHEVAVLVILLQQVTLHLGRDVGVHRAVELRHPLLENRDVLLLQLPPPALRAARLGASSFFSQPTRSNKTPAHATAAETLTNQRSKREVHNGP